jgi:hypothetical protein
MLTTAFLVLVTVAAMNANKMIVDRDRDYYEQVAYKEAAILANALLTEIALKDFDEYAASSDGGYADITDFSTSMGSSYDYYVNPGGAPDNFTPYRSISKTYFNDIDDYHGYKRSATAGNLTGFLLSVEVYYVSSTDLETPSSSRTYFKKIVVTVTNTTYFQKRDTDGDGDDDDDVELVFSTVKAY